MWWTLSIDFPKKIIKMTRHVSHHSGSSHGTRRSSFGSGMHYLHRAAGHFISNAEHYKKVGHAAGQAWKDARGWFNRHSHVHTNPRHAHSTGRFDESNFQKGQGHSVGKIVLKRERDKKEIGQPIYLKEVFGTVINSDSAKQNFTTVFSCGNLYQAIGSQRSGAAGAVSSTYLSPLSYLKLNPSQSQFGGQYFPNQSQTSDDKIILKGVNINLGMKNCTSSATTVHLFGYEPRSAQQASASGAWSNLSYNTEGAGVLQVETFNSAVFPVVSIVGTESQVHPGNFPHHHVAFRRLFKLVYSKRIDLAGGAGEEVDLEIIHNKRYSVSSIVGNNGQYLSGDSSSWTDANIANSKWNLPGSMEMVAIIQGSVGTSGGAASYNEGKVAFVVRRNSSIRAVEGGRNKVTVNLASTNIIGPVQTDFREINEVDQAVAPTEA